MEPFTLTDGVVELSVPTEKDVDAVLGACQDPAIQEWTTVPSPYRLRDAETFVRDVSVRGWELDTPHWAVREIGPDGPTLVGVVSCGPVRAGARTEIGYWMAPAGRGRGLLARALDLVLDELFARGVAAAGWSAEIHDGEPNWDSWRVAWRLGFRAEGVSRAAFPNKGVLHDGLRATLLATDPREPAAPWDGPARASGDEWAVLDDDPGVGADSDAGADPDAGADSDAGADPDAGADSDASADGPAHGGPTMPDPRDPEALVRQFHATYELPVVTTGPEADVERVHMRTGLVVEEAAELVGAVYGRRAEEILVEAFARAVEADDGARDTVEVADALGDLVYVAYGMALECGIPLPAVLREIQASNLSKLGEDGRPIYREDGKVLKGPGYFPPDVDGVLRRERLTG
ncbi:GNAT family N-acetyltransferase [Georgenia sp. Z1491]|uniref:GNAT family N-acetyltransferase n=1 Tax=Georgenia sp. Z1491 TaxID=3416707 RepID=UPI003CF06FB9